MVQASSPRLAEDPIQLLARLLGVEPFPWQERLLHRLIAGDLPSALDLPTGLGKTSVMAIWLVARAYGAPVPRRLVYVVDRRAVVDQATTEAETLRARLEEHGDVRAALGLTGDRRLPISTLRGQYADNRAWLEDPAAPAIVVGTVDMIGSRLLFEGYRTSRKMRPYEAGLLGADVLLVLDEAHLVPPFERLVRAVAGDRALHAREPVHRARIPPFRVLSLSATGRDLGAAPFRLQPDDVSPDPADGARHEAWRRVHARKRIEVERLPKNAAMAEWLVRRSWEVAVEAGVPTRVVIFVHKREDAEKTAAALRKRIRAEVPRTAPQPEVELLVGGCRVWERTRAHETLVRLGFVAGDHREPPPCHAFLVATSAGEVGVDLDADHAVCDIVAWERLVQRLGRVNRRGRGNARVVLLVHPEAPYAEAVTRLVERLPARDGGFGASPAELAALVAEAPEEVAAASTPEPLYPALTRALVDAWSMTSLEVHTGRPEVEPWLRGWPDRNEDKDEQETAVVWRRWLPHRDVERFFEAAPPHTSEVLEAPTWQVVEWLVARAADVVRRAREEGARRVIHALPAFDAAVPVTVEGLAGLDRRGRELLETALTGRTLVVDAYLGGLSEDGLLDRRADGPPITVDGDGEGVFGEEVRRFAETAGFRVRLTEEPGAIEDPVWHERYRQPWFDEARPDPDAEVERWLVVEHLRVASNTEDDRSSGPPQRLAEHQERTAAYADALARALGLDEAERRVLVTAARLHDEGKRAERWQRAFHAPADGGPYAKTLGPVDFALLGHYRHEFGSIPYAEVDLEVQALSAEDRDLVLHLIAAHHGGARPLLRIDGADGPPSVLERRAREVAERFARLQARWGPWGLAWWEALLRAADQQASRENDRRGGA